MRAFSLRHLSLLWKHLSASGLAICLRYSITWVYYCQQLPCRRLKMQLHTGNARSALATDTHFHSRILHNQDRFLFRVPLGLEFGRMMIPF